MKVRPIDPDNKGDVDRFVSLPYELYRDCEQWVPPLRSEMEHILDARRHPFYEHSTAEFFVAECDGQVLGRVAALDNHNFNRHHGSQTAFFGYFETVDDPEVASKLLDEVVGWSLGRGMDHIIGPRGVIGIDGTVLVEGFEHRPALGIPYNYPYYDSHIKQAGFTKDTDYLSGYIPGSSTLPDRVYAIAEKVKARRGFWIKTFQSKREIRAWIPRALEIHRQAMGTLHSYYPPTQREADLILETLLQVGDPRLIKLVMKQDNVAGFILAFPDVSAALQKMNGSIWPFGWFHFLREQRTTRWVNVNAVGLLPAYRGVGANTLLYAELAKTINESGYDHVDVMQVEENNINSTADMAALGVQWYKRHRHYQLHLT